MDRVFLANTLTILAILFAIFWKLTDPRSFKEKINANFKPKMILLGIFLYGFFTLNYLSGVYFPLPSSGVDQLITYLGIFTFLIGSGISVWAKVTMGKVWGLPAEHHPRQDKLIKHGPFKYSRNPIYVGLIMALIGYGLAIQSFFTFLVLLPIIYFWKAAEKEEELLEKHFKQDYLKYKKEVPRFF